MQPQSCAEDSGDELWLNYVTLQLIAFFIQCFDSVGSVSGRHQACKNLPVTSESELMYLVAHTSLTCSALSLLVW